MRCPDGRVWCAASCKGCRRRARRSLDRRRTIDAYGFHANALTPRRAPYPEEIPLSRWV